MPVPFPTLFYITSMSASLFFHPKALPRSCSIYWVESAVQHVGNEAPGLLGPFKLQLGNAVVWSNSDDGFGGNVNTD